MKINNIIWIEDEDTMHKILTYKSRNFKDINIILGENKNLFNLQSFSDGSVPIFSDQKLFPTGRRVKPIYLNNLSPNTLVFLRLRADHILFNTTLSPSDVGKEIIYDVKENRLQYLFFKQNNFTIRSKITHDDLGILNLLNNNLEDNQVREVILNLMSLPKPPNNINDLLFARADNAIRYEGDEFAVKYNGGREIRLDKKKLPTIDFLYIVKNKVKTDKASEIWKKLRGEKIDDSTAFRNMHQNYIRLLKIIKEKEDIKQVPTEQRLSNFIKNNIRFSFSKLSIHYTAPDTVKWYFDPEENFNALLEK